MPSILVHNISAKRILEKTQDAELKNLINNNQKSYFAGAQGTDNFYFFKYKFLLAGWKTKAYGWAAHHYRPKRYLITMVEYLKEHLTDNLFAYVLGYFTHYSLDKHIHALVKQDAPRLKNHTDLEQDLEVLYAQREGIDPFETERENFLYDCVEDKNFEIGKLHKYLIDTVYKIVIKCKEEDHSLSFLGWAKSFKNIDKPTKKQRRAIKFKSAFLSFDLQAFLFKKNEEMKMKYDFEKYFKAIDDAITEAVEYIKTVFDVVTGKCSISVLDNLLENINMQGALVIPMEQKKANAKK